jgi:hypothetical protein
MGVLLKVIGSAVVLVVLSYPPGSAEANQEAGTQTDYFIASPGPEHSSMPGIVSDVPYLSKTKGQERGVYQLEPGIIYDCQKGDTCG